MCFYSSKTEVANLTAFLDAKVSCDAELLDWLHKNENLFLQAEERAKEKELLKKRQQAPQQAASPNFANTNGSTPHVQAPAQQQPHQQEEQLPPTPVPFPQLLKLSAEALIDLVSAVPQGSSVMDAIKVLRAAEGDWRAVISALKVLEEALSLHAVDDEWRDVHKIVFLRALEQVQTPAQCGCRVHELKMGLAERLVSLFRNTEITKSNWGRLRKGRMFVPEIGQTVCFVRRGHAEHLKVRSDF